MSPADIATNLQGTVTVELVHNDPEEDAAYVVIHGRAHDGVMWTIYADNPSVYISGEEVRTA